MALDPPPLQALTPKLKVKAQSGHSYPFNITVLRSFYIPNIGDPYTLLCPLVQVSDNQN